MLRRPSFAAPLTFARSIPASARRLAFRAGLGISLSIAVALPGRTVAAQALPPASEVVARHVAAIGGREAILQITSMRVIGTMEIPTMGLTATTETAVAGNRTFMKQSIPGLGEIAQGYDGTVGWSTNPMQGPRLLAGKELAQVQDGADFQAGMLYSADRYTSMENQGIVDFNGEKAYKVHLVRKSSGLESTDYFSVATGVQIGSELVQESEMGKMPVQVMLSDYKQFGTIRMPTRSVIMMGANRMETTSKDVTLNSVPSSEFELPDAIKALVKP